MCEIDPAQDAKVQLNLAGAMKATDFNFTSTGLIDWEARLHPAQMYNIVKVCQNCYQLYSTLIANYKPKVRRPPTHKHAESSLLASSTSGRFPSLMKDDNLAVTRLGTIDKNSLNDLIADVSHANAELDRSMKTEAGHHSLQQIYSTLTNSYAKTKAEVSRPKKPRQLSLMEFDNASMQHSLANQLMPLENKKALDMPTKSVRALQSWQNYLSRLKHKQLGSRYGL
jgi:hypothetical protein